MLIRMNTAWDHVEQRPVTYRTEPHVWYFRGRRNVSQVYHVEGIDGTFTASEFPKRFGGYVRPGDRAAIAGHACVNELVVLAAYRLKGKRVLVQYAWEFIGGTGAAMKRGTLWNHHWRVCTNVGADEAAPKGLKVSVDAGGVVVAAENLPGFGAACSFVWFDFYTGAMVRPSVSKVVAA